jgi:CheY-like chemotaxis protein
MLLTKQRNKRILLAEDDDCLIFTLAVEDSSIAVTLTRAKNGDQVMEQLGQEIPDILFLDLEMPCKNGKQCLKEIRANPKYDELPIIIFSSFTAASDIDFCFREGANLYIIKPDSVADLTQMLKRILVIDWKKHLYFPPRAGFLLTARGYH